MKRTPESRNYLKNCKDDNVKSFGKYTMHKVTIPLTAREKKRKKGVNFVFESLVNHGIVKLKRVVQAFIRSHIHQQFLRLAENRAYFVGLEFVELHIGSNEREYRRNAFEIQQRACDACRTE